MQRAICSERGTEISIVVLVLRVKLSKRQDVESVVRGRLPNLSAAMQKQIAKLN